MNTHDSATPGKPRSASGTSSLGRHRAPRPADGPAAKPAFNDAESPLSWLRTRRDRSGQPLISDAQYLAGERLRSDFERSMLAPRTTTSWEMSGASGGGGAGLEISDGAIAARQRHHKALQAVGPELASILQHVCCMAAGLEEAERALNLPLRSGKAVLGLALTSLARHYGLLKEAKRGPGTTQWSLDDYRPSIPATELEDA